jgi:transcriptional regulator with XRE-family HTH domain
MFNGPTNRIMALSALGRKHLLPHGAQRKIARRLGVEESRVSAVVNGEATPVTEAGWKSWRRIQKAVARTLGLDVEEAFSDQERGVQQEVAA